MCVKKQTQQSQSHDHSALLLRKGQELVDTFHTHSRLAGGMLKSLEPKKRAKKPGSEFVCNWRALAYTKKTGRRSLCVFGSLRQDGQAGVDAKSEAMSRSSKQA